MTQSVEYLGHRLDAAGLHPTDKKVTAIKEAPRPTNVTELKAYLGLLSYYARFLKGVSTVLGPLHQLLHKDCKWQWTNIEDESFQKSKELLLSTQLLAHYDAKRGAVLAQVMEDGAEKPVAFASRSLNHAEKGYSTVRLRRRVWHAFLESLNSIPIYIVVLFSWSQIVNH